MQLLRYISLFSGGFGLDLGLELARSDQFIFQVAASVDIYAPARQTIRHNRPNVCVIGDEPSDEKGDLDRLTTPYILQRAGLQRCNIDLVVGGPPCQSWSILGNRQGFNDPRGSLMLLFGRVVQEAQPRAFIMENVEGFRRFEAGSALETMLSLFRRAGYPHLSVWILNAVDYGVPQYRCRVFVIGFREDVDVGSDLPPPPRTHRPPTPPLTALLPDMADDLPVYKTVRDALHDLPEDAPNHVPRIHGEGVRTRYMRLPEGARDAVDHTDRLCWDEPSGTVLVGSNGGGGRPFIHPQYPRHLTVREAARLQGFLDTWVFQGKPTAQYRQVGNAVPPPLAAVVGQHVARVLVNHLDRATH